MNAFNFPEMSSSICFYESITTDAKSLGYGPMSTSVLAKINQKYCDMYPHLFFDLTSQYECVQWGRVLDCDHFFY